MSDVPQTDALRFAADFPAFAFFLASGRADPVEETGPPMCEESIAEEEVALGVPLPLSYKRFLSLATSVGILGGGMRLNDPFWYDFGPLNNLPQPVRDKALSGGNGRWPSQSQGMLCFADFWLTGDGDQVMFDTKGGLVDGEYPVWYWDHERPAAYQIADDFRDWLERVVAGPDERTEGWR